MALDHTEIDLHGDLITHSDDRDQDRIFVWVARSAYLWLLAHKEGLHRPYC